MMRQTFILLSVLVFGSSCAPFWVVSRVEDKVDRLVQNTNRETLTRIFGDQASTISRKLDDLDNSQQVQVDEIMMQFERGSSSLDEIRSSLLEVLGGGERIVSSKRGIWVRNTDGKKLTALTRNTKLTDCKPIEPDDLPQQIRDRKGLLRYRWGTALYNDEEILFPWELTMSGFTKEIVENTARRTAEEFLKMAGDKAWNRPINIQVITEPEGKGVKISYPGDENEIYVSTDKKKTKLAENKEN